MPCANRRSNGNGTRAAESFYYHPMLLCEQQRYLTDPTHAAIVTDISRWAESIDKSNALE